MYSTIEEWRQQQALEAERYSANIEAVRERVRRGVARPCVEPLAWEAEA
jgi:quinol monooxygenase YgiN